MKQRKLTQEQKIAESYITSYLKAQGRLDSSLLAIERADSARHAMTQTLGAIPMSGSQRDRMCDSLALIDDSTEAIRRCSAAIGVEFADIDGFIAEVEEEDLDAGMALRMWYLDARSANYMARRLHCSRRHVYRVLDRGLEIAFGKLSGRDANETEGGPEWAS